MANKKAHQRLLSMLLLALLHVAANAQGTLRSEMQEFKRDNPRLFEELQLLAQSSAGVLDYITRPATPTDPSGRKSPIGNYVLDGVVTHLGDYGMQTEALRTALRVSNWDLPKVKQQFPALADECGVIAVVSAEGLDRRCFFQAPVDKGSSISTVFADEHDPRGDAVYGGNRDNGGPNIDCEFPTKFDLSFNKDTKTYYLVGNHTHWGKRDNGYTITELHYIRVDPDRLRIERIETYAIPPNEKLGPAYLEKTQAFESKPPVQPATVPVPSAPATSKPPVQPTPSAVVPTAAPKAHTPAAATPTSEQTSSTPWALVVMVFAAIGLLWLVLRRRAK